MRNGIAGFAEEGYQRKKRLKELDGRGGSGRVRKRYGLFDDTAHSMAVERSGITVRANSSSFVLHCCNIEAISSGVMT